MKKLFEQIFKFGIVGCLCFFVDYGLMISLTEIFGINYLVSSGLSFTVSVIINYILSLKFVFDTRSNNKKVMEFLIFILLSIIGLGLNQCLMWISVEKLHIFYMLSKIGTTAVVMVYNFITRKLILEKKKEDDKGEAEYE